MPSPDCPISGLGMNNSIDEKPQVLLIRVLAGDSAIGSFLTWKDSSGRPVNIRRRSLPF
jgi:hypothetical protein